MESFKRFFDDKLSDRCGYFSSLKIECISEKDCLHAINVWIMLKMNTMSHYHDFYLKTYVLLLADAFEKFINMRLEYYGLDLCHYFSSSGLKWDAILKLTKIKLELISDIDMYLFVEKGTRGCISFIAKRFSKVSNKYMKWFGDSN